MNLNTAINVTAAGTGLAAVGGLTHVAGRTAIDSHDPKLSEHDRDGAYVLSIKAGGFGAGITGLGGLAATGVLTDKPLTAGIRNGGLAVLGVGLLGAASGVATAKLS